MGTLARSVISSHTRSGTISSRIAIAPASSSALASSTIFLACFALLPCSLKPPSARHALRRQAQVAHARDAGGDDRLHAASDISLPPSSLMPSHAASAMKRPALRTAVSSDGW